MHFPATPFGSYMTQERYKSIEKFVGDVKTAEDKHGESLLLNVGEWNFKGKTFEGLVELWK